MRAADEQYSILELMKLHQNLRPMLDIRVSPIVRSWQGRISGIVNDGHINPNQVLKERAVRYTLPIV